MTNLEQNLKSELRKRFQRARGHLREQSDEAWQLAREGRAAARLALDERKILMPSIDRCYEDMRRKLEDFLDKSLELCHSTQTRSSEFSRLARRELHAQQKAIRRVQRRIFWARHGWKILAVLIIIAIGYGLYFQLVETPTNNMTDLFERIKDSIQKAMTFITNRP